MDYLPMLGSFPKCSIIQLPNVLFVKASIMLLIALAPEAVENKHES